MVNDDIREKIHQLADKYSLDINEVKKWYGKLCLNFTLSQDTVIKCLEIVCARRALFYKERESMIKNFNDISLMKFDYTKTLEYDLSYSLCEVLGVEAAMPYLSSDYKLYNNITIDNNDEKIYKK